jgi:hypothetical protein
VIPKERYPLHLAVTEPCEERIEDDVAEDRTYGLYSKIRLKRVRHHATCKSTSGGQCPAPHKRQGVISEADGRCTPRGSDAGESPRPACAPGVTAIPPGPKVRAPKHGASGIECPSSPRRCEAANAKRTAHLSLTAGLIIRSGRLERVSALPG